MISLLDGGLMDGRHTRVGPTTDHEDEMLNEDDLPKLSAPARRSLSGAGYTRLDQLAQVSEADLERLHGMGPTAITALREALHQRALSFDTSVPAPSHP